MHAFKRQAPTIRPPIKSPRKGHGGEAHFLDAVQTLNTLKSPSHFSERSERPETSIRKPASVKNEQALKRTCINKHHTPSMNKRNKHAYRQNLSKNKLTPMTSRTPCAPPMSYNLPQLTIRTNAKHSCAHPSRKNKSNSSTQFEKYLCRDT